MKLVMFEQGARTRPGLLLGAQVLDLGGADPAAPHDLHALIEAGPAGLASVAAVHELWQEGRLRHAELYPVDGLRLRPPLTRPSKIIAVGRNYADHALESGDPVPVRPMLFAKFPSAIVGPRDDIEWDPDLTAQVDYEAELAVVIGRRARHVPAAEALGVVFGYCCANDVSARDLQHSDEQWVRGKSLDTFCPLGPAIVTTDEVADPAGLRIACRLNGDTMQESNTARMVHNVPALIEFITRFCTLQPGDLILTGTPHGVGGARVPPVFLHDGDLVEVEIDGLGALSNHCREVRPS